MGQAITDPISGPSFDFTFTIGSELDNILPRNPFFTKPGFLEILIVRPSKTIYKKKGLILVGFCPKNSFPHTHLHSEEYSVFTHALEDR